LLSIWPAQTHHLKITNNAFSLHILILITKPSTSTNHSAPTLLTDHQTQPPKISTSIPLHCRVAAAANLVFPSALLALLWALASLPTSNNLHGPYPTPPPHSPHSTHTKTNCILPPTLHNPTSISNPLCISHPICHSAHPCFTQHPSSPHPAWPALLYLPKKRLKNLFLFPSPKTLPHVAPQPNSPLIYSSPSPILTTNLQPPKKKLNNTPLTKPWGGWAC
jgi:hypothetical protein